MTDTPTPYTLADAERDLADANWRADTALADLAEWERVARALAGYCADGIDDPLAQTADDWLAWAQADPAKPLAQTPPED